MHAPRKPLLETEFISMRFLDEHTVVFERTATPLPPDERGMRTIYQRMVSAMPADRAQLDLIVDSRLATGRNDAAFEAVQAEFRDALFGGFRRLVALVNSPTGRLQVGRYRNERPEPITILSNMDEAMEMLRFARKRWPAAAVS